MKRVIKIVSIVLIVALVALLIVPFAIPVPPLDGVKPPTELADADSQFLDVNGLQVHAKIAGEGQPVMVLLHGFGASTFSWREAIGPLSQLGTVIAYDRPGFGLTERPPRSEWGETNPYSSAAQVDLVLGLLDQLGVEKAILIGNSAGGTIATQVALEHPDRVAGLVLVDAAIYSGGGTPSLVRPLLNSPQMRHLGPLIARAMAERIPQLLPSAWHDPSKVTDEILAGYQKPLQASDWDRGLWEYTLASRLPYDLSARLGELGDLPVLVMTGDNDTWVPTAQSLRLAQEIPGAELSVLPACGHVPQEECPEPWLDAVRAFVQEVAA